MSGWFLWVIAACVFGVGERLTKGFFLAPFALGAVLAAIVELAGVGGIAAWAAFILVSLVAWALVRPIARARMRIPPPGPTGAAALVGKQAIVLERIANDEGIGCIKVDGEVWTARAFANDHEIETGTRVDIVDIKGATALVTE